MLVPNQTVGTTAAIPFMQVAIHFLLATERYLFTFPRPLSVPYILKFQLLLRLQDRSCIFH